MAQFGRPDSDISLGTWAPFPTSPTTLFDKINEVTPNGDADYIHSDLDEDVCEVSIGAVADPGIGTGHIIRCYAKSPNGAGAKEKLDIALVENGVVRAQGIQTTVDRTAYGLIEHALSEAEANAIQNYSNLRLRFHICVVNANEPINVTQAEFECPDAGQDIIKIVDETLQINEGNPRLMSMVRILNETVELNEAILKFKGLIKMISETLQINENAGKVLGFVRVINETLQIQEEIMRLKKMVRIISETLNISEGILRCRKMIRVIAENLSISESSLVRRTLIRVVNETINLVENIVKFGAGGQLIKVINETLTISENIARVRGLIKVINETLQISELVMRIRRMFHIAPIALFRTKAKGYNPNIGSAVGFLQKEITATGRLKTTGHLVKVINESVNISEGIVNLKE